MTRIARIARNSLSHPADFIGRNRCGQSRIGWEDGDNVRESSCRILFFQDVLPVIVGMERVVVLFAPLSDGETAVSLFLEETDPLIEFCMMNFLFCVHENLLNEIARNARIAQIARKYLESLSHVCGIIIRYS